MPPANWNLPGLHFLPDQVIGHSKNIQMTKTQWAVWWVLYIDEIEVRSNLLVEVAMWHGFYLLDVTGTGTQTDWVLGKYYHVPGLVLALSLFSLVL